MGYPARGSPTRRVIHLEDALSMTLGVMQLWPNIQEDMRAATMPNIFAHLVPLLYVGILYTFFRMVHLKRFPGLRSNSNQKNI